MWNKKKTKDINNNIMYLIKKIKNKNEIKHTKA